MHGTTEPGSRGREGATGPYVEDDAQREELERSRAKASMVATVCSCGSGAIAVGFVFDLGTMSASKCGPPAASPGWFVFGMIGLVVAGTIAADSARARARALDADTTSDTALVRLGIVLLIVMIVGSIIGVMAAALHGALGCTG